MEKKNGIVSALTDSVKTKKHITTKIEYFCNDTDDAERVFEKVTDILSTNLDAFAKITFDYSPADNKVDVEVIEHICRCVKHLFLDALRIPLRRFF